MDLIHPLPERVLEIGCGTGNTLGHLKSLGVRETVGVELISGVGEEARGKVDRIIIGDIETLELPFEPGHFDCVILGDVLEHLRDPWTTLRRLTDLLKGGGQIVASVPNIRFYEVSVPLLFLGSWEYGDEGILDRTHLRFFTRATVKKLFASAGLQVVSLGAHRGPKREVLNWMTLFLFRNLLTIQHLVKAQKP